MDYKGKTSDAVDTDSSLPDELNTLFTRFEENRAANAFPNADKDCVLSFSVADVS
jgi:hypothetical protein